MRNTMEKQLSWFALLMTAFYSLLASCRGAEECGHEELNRCARPLEKMTGAAEFITTKQGLEQLCPELQAGTKCIGDYTQRCMNEQQRDHFKQIYMGTNMMVMELCQDGTYQERFLKHAACMQEVKPQFDLCSRTYTAAMQSIVNGDHPNQVKSICCSFQEYLNCSHHTVLRKCGLQAAAFTKEFLDRMSSSLIKMHCQAYAANGQCVDALKALAGKSSAGLTKIGGFILPLVLFTASRYLLYQIL